MFTLANGMNTSYVWNFKANRQMMVTIEICFFFCKMLVRFGRLHFIKLCEIDCFGGHLLTTIECIWRKLLIPRARHVTHVAYMLCVLLFSCLSLSLCFSCTHKHIHIHTKSWSQHVSLTFCSFRFSNLLWCAKFNAK